jgi:hypothetical protein
MEEGAIWRKFGVCFAAASPKFSGNCPLKVVVYAIALNEAMHVDRWAGSAIDTDYRVVADTGSTDGTVERLEKAGVTVHKIAIRPWRFDDARNAALALVPADADVCVTMDMERPRSGAGRLGTPSQAARRCSQSLQKRSTAGGVIAASVLSMKRCSLPASAR